MQSTPYSAKPTEKLTYSLRDAEKALGISHATIYEIINNGQLKTFRIGRRRFISSEALCNFIKERELEEGVDSNV